MGQILGLDLGTNSIGWALVNDDKIDEMGIRVFPFIAIENQRQKNILKKGFIKLKAIPIKQKVTIVLFAVLTTLTIIDFSNWQFWLSLNITTCLTYLTMKND
jgi:RNase H-fold protein (predicted Holliday junction resolvase)